MVVRLLFETKFGERLLAMVEQKLGLAVVQADWLKSQCSGTPQNCNTEVTQWMSCKSPR